MASRSLLVVMLAVSTTCSLVLAERAEDISESEIRSIAIASHDQMLAVDQSDDAEVSGGFYTCCLKGYADKKPEVEISYDGVEKTSAASKMMKFAMAKMTSKSFTPEACLAMTAIPTSSCRDADGEPEEGKCETACIEELKKYKKYHQVTVDAQQKVVQQQQKEVEALKGKKTTAQAGQTKAETLVKDTQDKLTTAKADVERNKLLVKAAQSEVEKGEAELNTRNDVLQTLNAAVQGADSDQVPSECSGAKSCCCLIERLPVRVDVGVFSGWSQCTKSAAYPSSKFTKGCDYMKECDTCREKLCTTSKMKGIC